MGVLIYRTTPVLIPEESVCRRDFLSRQSTDDNTLLTEADYREYDSRTLFYDVFRCNDGKVMAIGPPPVNLRNELQKLRITCDGRLLPHRKREYLRLCVLELTCDQTTNTGKNLPLRFSFPSFHVEIEVPPPPCLSPAKTYRLGLMTLQKNNPLPWVLDWCRWHHRLHGVSRLILYDNASDNRDDLGQDGQNGRHCACRLAFPPWTGTESQESLRPDRGTKPLPAPFWFGRRMVPESGHR